MFDHGGYDPFLNDYGDIDLRGIDWQVGALSVDDFVAMPTGPSDADVIGRLLRGQTLAEKHLVWIGRRRT